MAVSGRHRRVLRARGKVASRVTRKRRAAAPPHSGRKARRARASWPSRLRAKRPKRVTLRRDPEFRAAMTNFDAAVRFFQKQNYDRAHDVFRKLTESSVREVADRARVHLRLCEQRLGGRAPALKSADDYYHLGVAELNARRLDEAIEHLKKADKAAPNREDVRYALAAAQALRGNSQAALEHLKAAIALRPENRFQARHDDDFHSLRDDPQFRQLVRTDESKTPRVSS